MRPNKGIRLHTFFLRYLFFLSLGVILLVVLLLGLTLFALSTNIVLPANYAETQISLSRDRIASSSSVTADMIPDLVDYAVFSKEGKFLAGNLSNKEAFKAWDAMTKKHSQSITHFYSFIERENEICILRYDLVPQYRSAIMRKYLPNPQLLDILLFIIGVITIATVLAIHFGRKLKKKMFSLQEAIEKIQNQNLDFSINSTGIREIDDISISLEQMKRALNNSLKQQWDLERARREQISALAHDLKTPLTIIRGNAELLQDTVQDETQKEYNDYILKNTIEIEKFTKQLIDLSKMEQKVVSEKVNVEMDAFILQLEHQMKALSLEKCLEVIVEKNNLPASIFMDKELFYRAMLNLIVNAVEHSPIKSKVILFVQGEMNFVHFTVVDSGAGFSAKDLKEATKQFYRGDPSRNSANHHGMGLYIAQSIITKHGGTLTLENDSMSGGGKVTITIPI
ncbi:sensor histidine kinase [Lysinibacillus pakistanensis]|uniref:histidine kinase n=1 Tax=Lysinibacillus pakistanensis TaxID=759811 RepID=A0AAX3X1M7_9BACI|nr:HAMP domain-containing sensor histidine kinase [Lysinibacillus pakistanensis]MDM5232318.1 HAMP domain-containing sensor histidine kinase [Lysinibacillus pakistanensis]WHY49129.1 HAMP domain-containing sensor histidine kinase [Lysinibacillus pakistanensis]WHY54140.1 HAMP domain-containing sensor histidine kinase [Lysinibacillus pakistanensis]